MKKRTKHPVDIEIDRLTDSIINTISGDSFATEIIRLTKVDLKLIKKGDWLFNWRQEFNEKDHEVYKLTIVDNPKIIQGLVSISDRKDHVYLDLIESAKFNKGKKKLYLGVSGNLVAFCCKKSFDTGYEGYVAFTSKTKLITHYQETLGATHLGGQQMAITPQAANKLIRKYFKI